MFGELLLRAPLFQGDSDVGQLAKIFSLLGTPSAAAWPGLASLPALIIFEHRDALPREEWERLLTGHPTEALALLLASLQLFPGARITASAALSHVYFNTAPLPSDPAALRLPTGNNKKSQGPSLR